MVKLIGWNIAGRHAPWETLLGMDADIALLQEAADPGPGLPGRVEIDPSPWQTAGAGVKRVWKAAVVKLSNRVEVEWIEAKPIAEAQPDELCVSRAGTLAAALVRPRDGVKPFLVCSMYAAWERMRRPAGKEWIWADGSAHRIVSDVSRLLSHKSRHRIVAAGDLNILYGHGEHGNEYARARYAGVFERMEDIGLAFQGPQAPHGRQADPWPQELPGDSLNVPTYHHSQQTPATATRQLDFVFASRGMAGSVQARALNGVDEWGPSDHCRVEIEIS